jgi:hypothetical protein
MSMGDDKTQKADPWFEKIQGYVTAKIGAFVAFLFFLVAMGAGIALFIIERWPEAAPMAVIVPALAGIVAYYNRTFALVMFVLLVVGVFFFI